VHSDRGRWQFSEVTILFFSLLAVAAAVVLFFRSSSVFVAVVIRRVPSCCVMGRDDGGIRRVATACSEPICRGDGCWLVGAVDDFVFWWSGGGIFLPTGNAIAFDRDFWHFW